MAPLPLPRMPLQLASGLKNAAAWDASEKRTAILVAGINYPRRKRGNEDAAKYRTYFNYCLKYKDHLFEKDKVDGVLIFDFLKGESLFFEKGGDSQGRLNFVYGPLHPKNFRYVDPDPKKQDKPFGSTLKVKRVPGEGRRYYFTAIDDFARDRNNGDSDADVLFDEYEPWSGGTEKSMSIADVYDMFTRVTSPRYQELHFFGHATHDGPVIAPPAPP